MANRYGPNSYRASGGDAIGSDRGAWEVEANALPYGVGVYVQGFAGQSTHLLVKPGDIDALITALAHARSEQRARWPEETSDG